MTTAADVMTTDVLTVRPDTPVTEVGRIILKNRITAVPVVDGEGQLCGIVSEDDLIRSSEKKRDVERAWWLTLLTSTTTDLREIFGKGKQPVKQVMSREVVTASEGTSLRKLVLMLSKRRIKQVPVTGNGKLVGIVSRIDILRYIAKERVVI